MKTLTLFILTAFFVISITAQQNRENIISSNKVLSMIMCDNHLCLETENGIVKYNKRADAGFHKLIN